MPAKAADKKPSSTAGKAPAAAKKTTAAKKTASKTAPADGKKKRKTTRKETYSTYIYRVLKQVHPDTGISNKAMLILNSFVNDIFERIASEASKLALYNRKSTISSREIQTAVRLILPGELSKHAISEGTKVPSRVSKRGVSMLTLRALPGCHKVLVGKVGAQPCRPYFRASRCVFHCMPSASIHLWAAMPSHAHACGDDCGHAHDDDAHIRPEDGEKDFLWGRIDRDGVVALNESVEGSGKLVIKPFDRRNDEQECVESDADEQLILRIPFTGAVKLRSILIKPGGSGQCPDKMHIFVNESLDFDQASEREPVQTVEIVSSRSTIEYPVRPAKYHSVQSLTLFFPSNHGDETTRIYFVGFRGEYTQLSREAINFVYEAQANPADHLKIKGIDAGPSYAGT
ncbi:uncharacterized protein L969DRAFT_53569 [Mixia osmundae IAM 14324]|uniref:Histone H2B n=1 Tax=Mixia osmundae (strain CBS 9802 / IAM 14324 / JCM 22182 / KY 12970) TaxID=764103 RepID=G7DSY8_MIXOS|nr:uncharacterized protein L969DRAFT_96769 [Mixia osmundae IAM 14324]XP_014565782.1 uncharacterized protein L969DRAFT_53569 [Mixia osmundae IAM 14324]KEI37210.1 hypothetical protein L969DRAFT_96769 [Mixia osmundae IAM 14324]KEI37225.1 hypothetical protein L969DRAFT_53569 [Mixia osmundae IAM 14324]GAA93698.1 hypothetical protein E5Q_00343 [Mixia osmundae IAM 14324]